jgi:hypothetical protein
VKGGKASGTNLEERVMAWGDEQDARIAELKDKVKAREAELKDANKARDRLFGEALVASFGAGVIDMVQMEKILRAFNERRPD